MGNGLPATQNQSKALANNKKVLSEGATYGFSYRVSPSGYWARSTRPVGSRTRPFKNNHFGGYTFGATGMLWKDNLFAHNDVYGLDPHDDSNNALVIEGNHFLSTTTSTASSCPSAVSTTRFATTCPSATTCTGSCSTRTRRTT